MRDEFFVCGKLSKLFEFSIGKVGTETKSYLLEEEAEEDELP